MACVPDDGTAHGCVCTLSTVQSPQARESRSSVKSLVDAGNKSISFSLLLRARDTMGGHCCVCVCVCEGGATNGSIILFNPLYEGGLKIKRRGGGGGRSLSLNSLKGNAFLFFFYDIHPFIFYFFFYFR